MQTCAAKEYRINLLRRQDAVETPLDAVENPRPREAVERNAQPVCAFNMEQKREIIGMEKRLLRRGKQRNALRRYVLRRCTNVYII